MMGLGLVYYRDYRVCDPEHVDNEQTRIIGASTGYARWSTKKPKSYLPTAVRLTSSHRNCLVPRQIRDWMRIQPLNMLLSIWDR